MSKGYGHTWIKILMIGLWVGVFLGGEMGLLKGQEDRTPASNTEDSANVDMVRVQRNFISDDAFLTESREDDIFRRRLLYVLPLYTPPNTLLLQATPTPEIDQPGPGIVPFLLDALLQQEITGVHPIHADRDYTYNELFWDMVELSGMSDGMVDTLLPEDYPWDHFNTLLLLGVDTGLSRMSQPFHRIVYVGLVWDPGMDAEEKPTVMCLFSANAIRPIIKKLSCMWRDAYRSQPSHTSVWRWLEKHRYRGFRVRPQNRSLDFLGPPGEDRSQRAMPDWYKP